MEIEFIMSKVSALKNSIAGGLVKNTHYKTAQAVIGMFNGFLFFKTEYSLRRPATGFASTALWIKRV